MKLAEQRCFGRRINRMTRKKLVGLAGSLLEIFPFISEAVTAHLEPFPTEHHPGRAKLPLIQNMKELKTDEFGP